MAQSQGHRKRWRQSLASVSPMLALSKTSSKKRRARQRMMERKVDNYRDVMVFYIIPFIIVNLAAVTLLKIVNAVDGIDTGILDKHKFVRATLDDVARDIFIILGLLVSASFIVLQMFASNFVSHAVSLFFRNRRLFVILAFVLTSAVFVLIVDIASGEWYNPQFALLMAHIFRFLCLSITMPYFKFLVHFLNPESLITQINADVVARIKIANKKLRSSKAIQKTINEHQAVLVDSVELLSDVGLSSLKAGDMDNTNNALIAIYSIANSYAAEKKSMPTKWFKLSSSIIQRADCSTLDSHNIDKLTADHTWFEWKLLKVYQMLVEIACEMRAVQICGLAAFYTHRMAIAALERQDHPTVELCLRFINTFIQFTIGLRDVSTTSNLLNEYRKLAIEVLEVVADHQGTDIGHSSAAELLQSTAASSSWNSEQIVKSEQHTLSIMQYLLHYATVSMGAGMEYIPQVVAHDMGLICSEAYLKQSEIHEPLLLCFLQLDDRADSFGNESVVRGVRRAQVKLALFFLCHKEEGFAREIQTDMNDDTLERMKSVCIELMTTGSEEFWEINDRSVNLDFLSQDLRDQLLYFFSWFSNYSFHDVFPNTRRPSAKLGTTATVSRNVTNDEECSDTMNITEVLNNDDDEACTLVEEFVKTELKNDIQQPDELINVSASANLKRIQSAAQLRGGSNESNNIGQLQSGPITSTPSSRELTKRRGTVRRGTRKIVFRDTEDHEKPRAIGKLFNTQSESSLDSGIRKNQTQLATLSHTPTLRNLVFDDISSTTSFKPVNRLKKTMKLSIRSSDVEKAKFFEQRLTSRRSSASDKSMTAVSSMKGRQLRDYCKKVTILALVSTTGASDTVMDKEATEAAVLSRRTSVRKQSLNVLSPTPVIASESDNLDQTFRERVWKTFQPSFGLAVSIAPFVAIMGNIGELVRTRAPGEPYQGAWENAVAMPASYSRLLLATLGQISNLMFVLMAVTSMINLQSSANRYKIHPHLLFFLNDYVLYGILSFVALTSQFSFMLMASIQPESVSHTGILLGSLMVSVCVILVATYFSRLFYILSPGQVVNRLRKLAVNSIQKAAELRLAEDTVHGESQQPEAISPSESARRPQSLSLSVFCKRVKQVWCGCANGNKENSLKYRVHPVQHGSPSISTASQFQSPIVNSDSTVAISKLQWQAHEYIKRVTDFAIASINHHDTGHLTVALNTLREIVVEYSWFKPDLSLEWFQVKSRLRVTSELVGLSDSKINQLSSMQVWLEYKVLYQYLQIFRKCLEEKQTEQSNIIAMHMTQLSELFLIQSDFYLTDVAVKFINTMLRFTINAGDQRTAKCLVQQYGSIAKKFIEYCTKSGHNSNDSTSSENSLELQVLNIAWLMRYYSIVCMGKKMFQISDAFAHQLSMVCSHSLQKKFALNSELLDLFLTLDDAAENSENALLGIRRAQTMFGVSCISLGEMSQAAQIAEDISVEPIDRIKRIMQDLLASNQAQFWEVGDTGVPVPQLTQEDLNEFVAFFTLIPDSNGLTSVGSIAATIADSFRRDGFSSLPNQTSNNNQIVLLKSSLNSQSEFSFGKRKNSRKSRNSSRSSRSSLRGSIDSVNINKLTPEEVAKLSRKGRSSMSLRNLGKAFGSAARKSVLLDMAVAASKRELHQGQVNLVGEEAKNRYQLFQQEVQTFSRTLLRLLVVLPSMVAIATFAAVYVELSEPKYVLEWELESSEASSFANSSTIKNITDIWKSKHAESARASIVSAELVMRYVSVVIMCTLITLQMSATRTLNHVFWLFIREPTVQFTWFIMLVVLIASQWSSISTRQPEVDIFLMGSVCLCPILLYPYFAHIYFFLDSNRMVSSVVSSQLSTVETISQQVHTLVEEKITQQHAQQVFNHATSFAKELDILADFGDSAMHFKDTENLFQIVNALCFTSCAYIKEKDKLPKLWFSAFKHVESISQTSDFVNLTRESNSWVLQNKCWVEWKVLRNYKGLFESSMGQIDSLCYRVAINSRLIAECALQNGNFAVLKLVVRYFNTYLNFTINCSNIRVGYHIAFQYRKLIELMVLAKGKGTLNAKANMEKETENLAVQCCGYLAHYATCALDKNLSFLAEVLVHDVAGVCGITLGLKNPKHRTILTHIISVESTVHRHCEVYTGVRMVQMHLAGVYLYYKDEASARLIYEAMIHDPEDQLLETYVNLMSTTQAEFWEFNERHYNIHYISQEIKQHVEEFYLWFPNTLSVEKLRSFLSIKSAQNQGFLDASSIGEKYWKRRVVEFPESIDGSLEKHSSSPSAQRAQSVQASYSWIVPCISSLVLASVLCTAVWSLDVELSLDGLWRSILEKPRSNRGTLFETHSRLAAVLFTVVLTPTLIVLQINDRQLMTHIAMEYLKSKAVYGMLVFFTCTNVFVISQMYLQHFIPSKFTLWISFFAVTGSALMLFPYFIFLFNFVNPAVVVDKVMTKCIRRINEAARNQKAIGRVQLFLVQSIAKLSEYGRTSMQNLERSKASHVVLALSRFLEQYSKYKSKRTAVNEWFVFYDNESIASSSEFMNSQPQYLEQLGNNKVFAEWLVLRQFHSLFAAAIATNTLTDVGQLITIHTYRAGQRCHQEQDFHGVLLIITTFNSYMRVGLNSRNQLVIYNLLHQYRRLASGFVLNVVEMGNLVDQQGRGSLKNTSLSETAEFTCQIVAQISLYLRLYAEEALKAELDFVAGVAVNDLQEICSLLSNLLYVAETGNSPILTEEGASDHFKNSNSWDAVSKFPESLNQELWHSLLNDILDEFIRLNTGLVEVASNSRTTVVQDMITKAMIKLSVQFQAQINVSGNGERLETLLGVQSIWNDHDRVFKLCKQLNAVTTSQYWEVNDRGVNFEYVPSAFRTMIPVILSKLGIENCTLVSDEVAKSQASEKVVKVDEFESIIRVSRSSTSMHVMRTKRRVSDTPEHDEEDVSVNCDNGTKVWTNSAFFLPGILGVCLLSAIALDVMVISKGSIPFGSIKHPDHWQPSINATHHGDYTSNEHLNWLGMISDLARRLDTDRSYMLATQRSMTVMLYTFLGFVITVSIVVLQIASKRFTSVVVSLFVRNRQFALLFIFFVSTAVYATIVSTVSSKLFLSRYSFVILVGLAFSNFFALYPFVAMLFSFLDSDKVFLFIARDGMAAFPQPGSSEDPNPNFAKKQIRVAQSLDQIADFGLVALHQKDKHNTYRSIQLIVDIGIEHIKQNHARKFCDTWFKIGPDMKNCSHFVSLTPDAISHIERSNTWLSWVVLKLLQKLYGESIGFFHDGCTRVGVNTRRLLEAAIDYQDMETIHLISKFFNTFMRTAINKRDLRAADHVSRQYRLGCAYLLTTSDSKVACKLGTQWVGFLKSYLITSSSCDSRQVAPIIIGHDIASLLAFVARRIAEGKSDLETVHGEILQLLLQTLSADVVPSVQCRDGLLRATMKLAANYELIGPALGTSLARIMELFEQQDPEKLEAMWDLFDQSRGKESFWEVADRGSNLDHLSEQECVALDNVLSRLSLTSERDRLGGSTSGVNVERLKKLRKSSFN